MEKRSGLLSKIEGLFSYYSDLAQPIPILIWFFISVIAGWIIPAIFIYRTVDVSVTEATIAAIVFLIAEFVFIYVSVWILTYFYYRRFKTTRRGYNFFTSKWFRFEQITLYIAFFICVYGAFADNDPTSVFMIGPGWWSVMVPLYFLEWVWGGRRSRHESFDGWVSGQGNAFRSDNRRDYTRF